MKDDAAIDATAGKMLELVASKPENYFYAGTAPEIEKGQRALFTALGKDTIKAILKGFGDKVRVGHVAVVKELQTNYGKPNASPLLQNGSPGQSDGSGDLIPKLLLIEEMKGATPDQVPDRLKHYLTTDYPALPKNNATATDNMSTWKMVDRGMGQLDGSVRSPFFRNVAAILAITGDPQTVSVQNAEISAEFIAELPAPGYPFGVDTARVDRGAKLFQDNCAACHHANNTAIYRELNTDFNRARVLNTEGKDLFLRNFVASVPETFEYTGRDGQKVIPRKMAPGDIVFDRTRLEVQGYKATPLDGIWASAPYLHNGSVPTLRHLLAPDNADTKRPTIFVRGAVSYDPTNVGFSWDDREFAALVKANPAAARFDTQWDGASNAGHDQVKLKVGDKDVRLNWSGEENKGHLEDLLEYLKSL